MKVELFNELFGCYYNAVYHILKNAANKELTNAELKNLIKESSDYYGFSETTNFIVEKAINLGIKETVEDSKDAWPFFDKSMREEENGSRTKSKNSVSLNRSRLNNISSMPLSNIEKKWLKSIYSDPRIQLFVDDNLQLPEFPDIEPLFDWKDIVYFDQYSDGDPFQDRHYIEMFRKVLTAVRNKSRLEIEFRKPNNKVCFDQNDHNKSVADSGIGTLYIDPDYLEFSERDNKFRLIGNNPKYGRNIVNISKIASCKEVERISLPNLHSQDEYPSDAFKKKAVFELVDNNNSLERFLLNFSHYEKEAEYLTKEKKYRITIIYDVTDETDVLIRTLSFGSYVKCFEPKHLVEQIRKRLQEQINHLHNSYYLNQINR